MISINEKAESYINEKATSFLAQIKPDANRREKPKETESSNAHVFVSGNLTDADIISIGSMGYVDQLSGRQVARYFLVNNVPVGLDQESFAAFDKFIDDIYERKEINSLLSKSFIHDCSFEWLENKYKSNSQLDLMSFLKEKAGEAVRKYKVSLPISFLAIQVPFTVGKVSFDYCTKDFCDNFISNLRTRMAQQERLDENNLKVIDKQFRSKYQGKVFASITTEGEKQRCIEIAKIQVEKALTVLRFFSPSAFIPEVPCYFGLMGQTDIPKSYSLVFEDQSTIPSTQETIDERRMHTWPFSASDFMHFTQLGLGLAAELYFKEECSEFEDLVLNSMYLFGRSLTESKFQDKVVYVLVSIETLLLQNQSEPIQSSVGLRLAFLTRPDAEKRKKVKELVNKAYKFRSSYIHHGKVGENWELLRDLQHAIWDAIRNALLSTPRFKTQKEFLDRLETIIMS